MAKTVDHWHGLQPDSPNSFGEEEESESRTPIWLLAAIILSLLLHLLILFAFKSLRVEGWKTSREKGNFLEFIIDRVQVDAPSDELEEKDRQNPNEDKQESEDEAVDETDFENLQKLIPDRDITLSAAVSEIENAFEIKDSQSAGEDVDQSENESDVAKTSLDGIDMGVDEKYTKVSLNVQDAGDFVPRVQVGDLGDSSAEAKYFAKLRARDGDLSSGVLRKYSSLDELMRGKGKITDPNKPILMPADLMFDYDSYKLKDSSRQSLMKLAYVIQRNPKAKFVFEGHADLFGPDTYNQRLSELRAASVKNWLQYSLGIESKRMRIVGFGSTQPLIKGGNKEEQALNRRVEIRIQVTNKAPEKKR